MMSTREKVVVTLFSSPFLIFLYIIENKYYRMADATQDPLYQRLFRVFCWLSEGEVGLPPARFVSFSIVWYLGHKNNFSGVNIDIPSCIVQFRN